MGSIALRRAIRVDGGKKIKGLKFNPTNMSTINEYTTFYIYKVTSRVNGKVYVGQTHSLTKRFAGHMHMDSPLRQQHKFGDPERWEVEVLDVIVLDKPHRPSWAGKVMDIENSYILKAIKKYGKKCVNFRTFKVKEK